MRRALLASAAALALLSAGGAPATSLGPTPPHDPKLACKAIKQLVADLNSGRLRDPESWGAGPTFFTDGLGEVEDSEEQAFLHAMRRSEGRPDAKPIELRDVRIVHKDKEDSVYLVLLDRESWHEKRLVSDGMLGMEEIDDPHYATDTGFWLARFMSNDLTDFREAPEMNALWLETPRLKGCH
ncbi:MAG TPA: hypothetical protein VF547_07725 [Allosphingosinicella sp.]|jgi:hypothetical protein